jgi:hypothetical protein
MKTVFLLLVSLAIASSVHAQKLPGKCDYLLKLQKDKPIYSSFISKPANLNYLFVKEGTICTLPLDNMPCLIPIISSVTVMPVASSYIVGTKMPNAFDEPVIFPRLEIMKAGK